MMGASGDEAYLPHALFREVGGPVVVLMSFVSECKVKQTGAQQRCYNYNE